MVMEVDGRYIDIYTHYLLEKFRSKNTNILEFETHYRGKHKKKFENYMIYTNF